MAARLAVFAVLVWRAIAIDNGLGLRPPMGWRSWNQFGCDVNQELIVQHYEQLAKKGPGGGPSLAELGYQDAGVDDCWQECKSGPGGEGFHDATGKPIVNKTSFPDLKAMTDRAKELGLVPGWYGNNCHCADKVCSEEKCFSGDVQATLEYGFGSIKLDGCGVEKDVELFAKLFNATAIPILIENCHNGNSTVHFPHRDPTTGELQCPMNFFRSSTDIRPTFGSILINLRTASDYNRQNLTGPGCWAYPDMLEVGVTNSQRPGFPTLSFVEARSHFAAWCLLSAPLILGNDLRDEAKMQEIWPIIANRELISVNQAWIGDSGSIAAFSSVNVTLPNCSWFNQDSCEHPSWMVLSKRMSSNSRAVMFMNQDVSKQDVYVSLDSVGIRCSIHKGCRARDLYLHEDVVLAAHGSKIGVSGLGSHDSAAFLVFDEEGAEVIV